MLRDRLLGARWLVWLIVGWGVLLAAAPHQGEAAPLPPARASETASAPEDDLGAVRAALEQKIVRARLAALGVAPAEVETVLARLSPAERSELAARAQELSAGGSVAPAIIAVAILVGLLVVLILELMGRRVVSRP